VRKIPRLAGNSPHDRSLGQPPGISLLSMTTQEQRPGSRHWVRLGAFLGLVLASGLALPLSAYAVEAISAGAENWIFVVYLAVMAVLGAGVGALLGRLAPDHAPSRRGVLSWAGLGVLAAALGAVVWLVALAG
jgi:uncharacterized membrane protein